MRLGSYPFNNGLLWSATMIKWFASMIIIIIIVFLSKRCLWSSADLIVDTFSVAPSDSPSVLSWAAILTWGQGDGLVRVMTNMLKPAINFLLYNQLDEVRLESWPSHCLFTLCALCIIKTCSVLCRLFCLVHGFLYCSRIFGPVVCFSLSSSTKSVKNSLIGINRHYSM